MLKVRTLILFSIMFFCLSFSVAFAYGKSFGGRIFYTGEEGAEVPEVETYQSAGYDCEMQGGKTLQVYYKGQLTSFYYQARPVTNTTPAPNQQILGLRAGTMTIVCTKPPKEKGESPSVQKVTLPRIIKFGTSRR